MRRSRSTVVSLALVSAGGLLLVFLLIRMLLPRQELILSTRRNHVDVALDDAGCVLLARITAGVPDDDVYLRTESRATILELAPGTKVEVLDGRVLRGNRLLPYDSLKEEAGDILVNRVLVLDGPKKGPKVCMPASNIRGKWPMF